jgi:hypothetical protein
MRKKNDNKNTSCLRRPPMNENHTTTNQKHVGATKKVKEGSCNRQEEHRGAQIDHLGAIELGSISN